LAHPRQPDAAIHCVGRRIGQASSRALGDVGTNEFDQAADKRHAWHSTIQYGLGKAGDMHGGVPQEVAGGGLPGGRVLDDDRCEGGIVGGVGSL